MNQQEQAGVNSTSQREAVNSYNMRAEHGDISDQFNLAYMYDIGWTVPEDHAEAFKWYRKAAERGCAQAQYKLGRMYGKGRGVPKNHEESFVWLSIAAASGYKGAIKKMNKKATKLTPEALQLARARAARIFAVIQQQNTNTQA